MCFLTSRGRRKITRGRSEGIPANENFLAKSFNLSENLVTSNNLSPEDVRGRGRDGYYIPIVMLLW